MEIKPNVFPKLPIDKENAPSKNSDPYDLDLEIRKESTKGEPVTHCSTRSCACGTTSCTRTCTCACVLNL